MEGDFSVEGHRTFPDDPWQAGGNPFEEGAIDPECFGFKDAPCGLDLRIAKDLDALAGV